MVPPVMTLHQSECDDDIMMTEPVMALHQS